jgi:hypothetical protein
MIMRFLVRSVSFQDAKLFPKCSQCIYFEPRDFKCRRFGEVDPFGRVTYEYADLCRKHEHKCGPLGKYFERK